MEVRARLWKRQAQYFKSQKKIAMLRCGVGYGKTYVGALDMIKAVYKYPNRHFLAVARDMPQFRKAMLPEILKALSFYNMIEGVHYKKTQSPFKFEFWNGVIIHCVGASNYDSAFRGPNIAYIWADEVEYYKKEAWLAMLGRLRVSPELLRLTSTPNGFNFVSDLFLQKNDNREEIVAPTWENRALSEEYIELLRSTYSPRLFQQECGAKRLVVNDGAVYEEFKRDIHVQPCKQLLKDHHQLYFFTDYNIANYCGVYMFYDKESKISYAIGEEHLKFQGSRIMAEKVFSRYPKRPVIVVGDSTGNNKRDVAIEKTNYQHFRDAGLLTESFLNPPVESRIISANSNLYHKRCVIDPECVSLIKDLELLAWLEDGSGIDKTTDMNLSHASDAWSYGDYRFQGIKRNKKAKFTVSHY